MVGSMAYDSTPEAVFDAQAADYEFWYHTPQGKYADALEKELFLKLIRPKSGQSVLDIGCGTGHYLTFFQQLGLETAGIDISKPMLEVASQKLGSGAQLYWGGAEKLPFDNSSFDIVTLITTLEFVSDPLTALRAAARVSRSTIFLGFLNSASLLALTRRIKGKLRRSIYNQARFYSIWGIKAMVKEAIGSVPLAWQSTLFFPLSWHKYTHRLDRLPLLSSNPFGAFLGIKLDIETRAGGQTLTPPSPHMS